MSTSADLRGAFLAIASKNALFVGLVILGVFFAVSSPVFFTAGNLRDVIVQVSILAIVAVPSAILLLSGGVDLSIGSTVALGGVVTGTLLTGGVPVWLAMFLGICAGVGIGLINGVLCALLDFSPIIVTLGMLTAVRGLVYVVNSTPVFGFPDAFTFFGRGQLLGIPVLVVIAALMFIAGSIFLYLTPWGRHVFALGVNRDAAFLSGVSMKALPLFLYIFSGASAGLGGVLLAARLNTASAGSLGVGFELDVLTAVLLGGVAFGGGRGSLMGVLIGVLFLGVLSNGLILLNVFPFYQLLAKGLALVVAAGLDVLSSKNARGSWRALRRRRRRRRDDDGRPPPDGEAASQRGHT